ncbi:hypothetical protein [Paucibacter soli]|uniref:hypothetical protein n=1 Tax=Paucibacter soli TaxID=3133433 RepID=UPI0030A165B7
MPIDTVTNLSRAQKIKALLAELVTETGCTEKEALVDLICNTMHYARMRNADTHDFEASFNEALYTARSQHEVEFNEDPEGVADVRDAPALLAMDSIPATARKVRRPR